MSFDRSAIYYKMIRNKRHHNYPYKLGLNTVTDNNEIFREAQSYDGSNSIRFYDIKYVFEHLDRGNKVCILTIPDDVQVTRIYNNEYGANRIYIHKIMKLNYDVTKHLIECGANVIIENYKFPTIISAAHYGYFEVIKVLADYKHTTINNMDRAIHRAASNGHIEIVKYLAERGAKLTDVHYVMIDVAYRGHIEIMKYLIECKSPSALYIHNSTILSAILCASQCGHLEAVKYLIKHSTCDTIHYKCAISYALESKNQELVEYLRTFIE